MNPEEHGCIDSLTESVLGAVFEVSNTLGAGFLEKVYERALLRELGLRGIRATAQASFAVSYKGQSVGEWKRIALGFQIPQRVEEPGARSQAAEKTALAPDEHR